MLHTIQNAFSFIPAGHPFHAEVERFRSLCASDPLLARRLAEAADMDDRQVRSVLRGRLSAGGGWQFRALCISFQSRRTRSSHTGFRALTLFYSSKTNAVRQFLFPEDPYLAGLPGCVMRPESEVLRYVPRRRVTIRAVGPGNQPSIGKCVRPAEGGEAWRRLVETAGAVERSGVGFAVAAPLGAGPANGVFYQQKLPGRDLTALLDALNGRRLLSRLGSVHAELHRLPKAGMPVWEYAALLDDLIEAVECIACFRPESRPALAKVLDALLGTQPRQDPRSYTFCHGDFSCSQALHDGERWSVVDFDRCLSADPHMEVAKLMAFMKYDVPVYRRLFASPSPDAAAAIEELCETYLAGYRSAAQREFDCRRLLWYRLCFEIQYVARLFKRDCFDSVAYSRALEGIDRLFGSFQKCAAEVF